MCRCFCVTQAGGLHPRRCVDRISKQAVTRHLRPYNPCNNWTYRNGGQTRCNHILWLVNHNLACVSVSEYQSVSQLVSAAVCWVCGGSWKCDKRLPSPEPYWQSQTHGGSRSPGERQTPPCLHNIKSNDSYFHEGCNTKCWRGCSAFFSAAVSFAFCSTEIFHLYQEGRLNAGTFIHLNV